jgi:coenzyme F420-reducing hydrogenase beta subunit
MVNSISTLSDEKCTGCQLCSAICPHKAIQIGLNSEGFYRPLLDEKLCTDCGLCCKICYKFHEEGTKDTLDTLNDLSCYAAFSKNSEILYNSSSGGIAYHLAKHFVDNGVKCIGVKYDSEQHIAIADIALNRHEIEMFRGSKYMQAFTEKAFREILEDRSDQKYAIFGTPCQIYAFDKYARLRKIRDRFILIDFFCHGCPSIFLWQKHLAEVQRIVGPIKEIKFRSKKFGWHGFVTEFIGEEKKMAIRKLDNFYFLFFEDILLNRACYQCELRGSFRYCDIRFGDFWGIDYDLNTHGVSAVIPVTSAGAKVFEQISSNLEVKEHELEDVLPAQSISRELQIDWDKRKYLLKELVSQKPLGKIVFEYKNGCSKGKKLRFLVKGFMEYLPLKVVLRIKRRYHLMTTNKDNGEQLNG